MILMLTGRRGGFSSSAPRTLTLSLGQFVTLNVFFFLRSTDKKGKKSPGYRFDFWLFGERKEKRGREGSRWGREGEEGYQEGVFLGGGPGSEVEGKTTVVISWLSVGG